MDKLIDLDDWSWSHSRGRNSFSIQGLDITKMFFEELTFPKGLANKTTLMLENMINDIILETVGLTKLIVC